MTADVAQDIEPFIVYRIDGVQMVCAVWILTDGRKALALFLSGDSATDYRNSLDTSDEWRIFQPTRNDLLEILKECYEAGIGYAVLDPDLKSAKRIFNIEEILTTYSDQDRFPGQGV